MTVFGVSSAPRSSDGLGEVVFGAGLGYASNWPREDMVPWNLIGLAGRALKVVGSMGYYQYLSWRWGKEPRRNDVEGCDGVNGPKKGRSSAPGEQGALGLARNVGAR